MLSEKLSSCRVRALHLFPGASAPPFPRRGARPSAGERGVGPSGCVVNE